MRTVHVFQNFYENLKEYEESLNYKAISVQIYNQTCNLLYRRLVEVLEHFPESPQLEKTLAMEDCPSLWPKTAVRPRKMFSSL